ncbi:hypothetical protein AB6H14_07605 [Providencia vermicola]
MTVSTEISSNEYTGNGVTTDFDYKFMIFKANQLSVITSDADGDNVVTLRLGTDYTVTGANKSIGGKVILTKPLANGHKISIYRDIPITQETSFRNQSKFFAENHEDAFDYLTMIIQRIWGSLGSLYLKRPNILANWFDAKGYRIANLGKPKRDSDAVDLGTLKDEISGVNNTILKREKRLLRVDDMDIVALPKASERAGNVITFDKDGKPIVIAPATGSAIDVLNQLSNGNGSLIGVDYGSGKIGNLNEYLSLMFSSVINVQLHGILADNSDHSDALSYLITNAPPQSILYFPNGDYLLRGIKVQRDDISIIGQSIDGVRITLGAGSDGIFWRCGVRGPMSDTRNDNIPVYAGNDDFYVAANCSPALHGYPRNKNIKLNNITFILTDRFGTGNGVGVEFHRLDDYEKNIKIEWESEFEFGNGCRHYFCNGLKSDIFVTAPNKNTTYSVLYFWSFGARIGEWQIGEGKVLNIDFKHAVDLQAKVIKGISTTALTGGAVQFGYGSRNASIGTLQGIGAGVRLRAAEEFERAKSFTIDKLVIDNPEGDGLTLGHVDNLNIGNYDIRAKTPLTFTFIPYLVSSSEDTNFIPKKNTSRWVYDGNYDTIRTDGNITKYLEYRANPTLSRFKFGVGTLTKVGASEAAVYFNIAGGSEPFYDANGLLPRINSMPDRTINTSRADAIYDGQPPASIHRGDFGEMNIIYESGASSNSGAVFMGGQVNDVVGKINLSPRTATVWLALLNSNITLNFRQPQTAAGSPLIRLYLMQNSSLDGDWQCGSYPVLFENYAFNEKISGNFGANFIFNSTPIDAPLIRTQWSKEEPMESTNSISFNGAKCPPLANLRQLIRHYGTVKNPNGVDEIGGGLSCEGAGLETCPCQECLLTATAEPSRH